MAKIIPQTNGNNRLPRSDVSANDTGRDLLPPVLREAQYLLFSHWNRSDVVASNGTPSVSPGCVQSN